MIHVDASDDGWGIHSNLIQTSGFWTPAKRGLSINVRELKAILFALQMHGPNARGWNIKMYMDNITALKYVTKSGGTASLFLQDLAIQIQETINKYNMMVHFQHIPGIQNIQSDKLSRQKTPLYEWNLPRNKDYYYLSCNNE